MKMMILILLNKEILLVKEKENRMNFEIYLININLYMNKIKLNVINN